MIYYFLYLLYIIVYTVYIYNIYNIISQIATLLMHTSRVLSLLEKHGKNKVQLFFEKYFYNIKIILSAKNRGQNRKYYQTNGLENKFFHKRKQK